MTKFIKKLIKKLAEMSGFVIFKSAEVPKNFLFFDMDKVVIDQSAIINVMRKQGFELYDLSRDILEQEKIKDIIEKSGYEIFLKKESHHYVPDYYGRSAHERADIRTIKGFGNFATEIMKKGRALLYYDRLYIIYQYLKNVKAAFATKTEINFAEVGVYKGGTSWFISRVAENLGIQAVTLHCFDTFKGHSPEDITKDIDYEKHVPYFFGDIDSENVINFLQQIKGIIVHQGRFQDTSAEVKDLKFHFVHLDVDLYEPTLYGLQFFKEHLEESGIIIIDDYGSKSCPGVKMAIDEFLIVNKNFSVLHPFTEQLILMKLKTP